jgi:hypothetical protein
VPEIVRLVRSGPLIKISNHPDAYVCKLVVVCFKFKFKLVKDCPACGVTATTTCLYPSDVSVPLDIPEYAYSCNAVVPDAKFSTTPSPQSTV